MLSKIFGIGMCSMVLCMIGIVSLYAQSAPSGADVESLQRELQSLEKQIAAYEKNLSSTKQQRVHIANLISKLKKERNTLQEQIRLGTLSLLALQNHVDSVLSQIDKQTIHARKRADELASLTRFMAIASVGTPFESFVLRNSFSAFLDQQDRMLPVIHLFQLKLAALKANLVQLREKREELDIDVRDLSHVVNKQSIRQNQVMRTTTLQTDLLIKTKKKETTVAQQLAASRAKAKTIRNRIYELFNVGKQISFGTAYGIAQWVARQYHIRPAYLLAVLTQESNLGKNVGTCNRATDPPKKHWRAIMKPERDHEPFLKITKELGLDPDTTPVSCPMMRNGKQLGWGGAMGPAQFIPSTWMGYREKVRAATGKTPNPWDIRDAFIAAAIKLNNDGASSKGGEFNAALKYFSGSVNLTYRYYGDNVLAIAQRYEEDIRQLEDFSE